MYTAGFDPVIFSLDGVLAMSKILKVTRGICLLLREDNITVERYKLKLNYINCIDLAR